MAPTMLLNAVDMEKFHLDDRSHSNMRARFNIAKDQCVVLFVGRLEEIKRVDLAIETMSRLTNANGSFHLFIAGEVTLRERLEKQAEQLKVAGKVSFLGSVVHSELPAFYDMADILILPSEMEGVPMVILESLACGTPVVASGVGGIPDVGKDGVNGIVLEAVTDEELAEGIVKLKNKPPDRTGVAQSVEHLSTICFVQELQAIFEKTLEKKRRARAS